MCVCVCVYVTGVEVKGNFHPLPVWSCVRSAVDESSARDKNGWLRLNKKMENKIWTCCFFKVLCRWVVIFLAQAGHGVAPCGCGCGTQLACSRTEL